MSIAKFLNSSRVKTKLDAIVDNTHAFLVDPNKEDFLKREGKRPDPKLLDQYGMMDQYFPVVSSDDFRVLEYLFEQNKAIASVIATGQEIPQTRMGRLLKIEGQMGKIAISHIFGEEDEIRMMELSKMQGMPKNFVDMLIRGVDSLQPRVYKTANVLTWQCVTQGFVDYTDTRSNAAIRLRYQTYPELFPAPLTGNAVWTDYENANGVRDLREHARAFYNLNGFYPDETVMPQELADDLMSQASTRDHALALGLISAVPGTTVQAIVDEVILNRIAERLKFPKIRIYDAQYEIEFAPGQTVRGRYLPSHTYAFLTDGMGQRLFGPTIEGKGKPGVFVKVDEVLKSSPPESRSYAVARMFPFVPQPKLLAARKVK
ncbi:hypothetical protein [Brasilonema sp. UFV-L1]|uniref:hypothetical protein n=1 Tax=Brasilonema sp. UFV-L1 TaxID=2234130 RepID=UPI00145E320B|nr:hypothetical protein [Brasilonema sp. UFV-L1]NMG11552.1 hypothetical protein [Brasilonema sp. UFV-L1]